MISTCDNPSLRFTPARRLLMFVFIAAACLMVGAVVVAVICLKGATPARLRLSVLAQDVIMFVTPALLTALAVSYKPWRFLRVDAPMPLVPTLLAVAALLASIPCMNALVAWNQSIALPPALAGLEQWMRQAEDTASQSIAGLMGGTGVGDLVISLLLVGAMAGVSEEFFFRGGLQRLLATAGRTSPHAAVWLAALAFSAFHMQFYGFFPRLLLGAYFGYLLWWTRCLWVPVLLHALNNSLVVSSDWASRRGLTDTAIDQAGASSPVLVAVSLLATAALVWGVAWWCGSRRHRIGQD